MKNSHVYFPTFMYVFTLVKKEEEERRRYSCEEILFALNTLIVLLLSVYKLWLCVYQIKFLSQPIQTCDLVQKILKMYNGINGR